MARKILFAPSQPEVILTMVKQMTPAGFELVGADRTELPSGPAGAVLYRNATDTANGAVLLLVHALTADGAAAPSAAPAPSSADGASGLHELSWSDNASSFMLVSALTPDELRRFVQ